MISYRLDGPDYGGKLCYEASLYGRAMTDEGIPMYIGLQWLVGIPSKADAAKLNGFGFGFAYKAVSSDQLKENYLTPSISYHAWISNVHSLDFMVIDHKNPQLQLTVGWYLRLKPSEKKHKPVVKCPLG